MIAEATLKTPPKAPEEICQGCLKPIQYRLKPDWDRLGGGAFTISLARYFCFDRIEHPECIEANERKAKEAEAATERAFMDAHEEREKADRKSDYDRWYAKPTLPLDVLSKTFDTFQDTGENAKSLSLLKKWREGDDFGFLLYGPSGTGKSHLGFALMRKLLDSHLAKRRTYQSWKSLEYLDERFELPHYESVASMLSSLRGTSGELHHGQLDSPILFLDDLGAESITEWSREIFFRLFEHRLNRRLPVVITSNLSLNELKERMHERVVSRLLGLCIPLQIKGEDRRKDMLADRVKRLAGRSA